MSRALFWALVCLLAASLAVGCSSDEALQKGTGDNEETTVEAQAPTTNQPNIIFVLTDDLDYNSAQQMPNLRSELVDKGTSFENAFISEPLCCPSRATILTGLYAHNHGVLTNNPPDGGFEKFVSEGHEQDNVATRLQQGGYETALFGKYLNHYPANDATHVPPGWDEWHAWADTLSKKGGKASDQSSSGESAAEYYGYSLNENGEIVSYGNSSEDYMTDVLSGKATDFIQRATSDSKPFFVYLAPTAPHGPPVPAERHKDAFASATAPQPPSFDEQDVSDKPPWIRDMSRFSNQDVYMINDLYRKRLGTMQAVDEMVDSLLRELEADGQLENTFVFFSPETAFLLAHHRKKNDKRCPYEKIIRTPLFVRGPGVPPGAKVEKM